MSEMLLQGFLRNGKHTNDSWIHALELKGIKVKHHAQYPNLCLFKYDMVGAPEGDPLVNECRGVILDEEDDWRVIARGFDRFYNLGSGHAKNIDWSTARVQEKLDGSLCVLYHYKLQWHVATSGTPDASGNVNGGNETFAQYFWRVWGDRGLDGLDLNQSYIFELTGPLNRIVVPHTQATLTLLSSRHRQSGKESHRSFIISDGMKHDLAVVKEYALTNFEQCLKTFDHLNGLHNEGYVVVDGAFNRVKVKHPGYVALHHIKDGMGPKAFMETARKGEVSEVSLAFPEFASSIKKAKVQIDCLVRILTDIEHELDKQELFLATQKEYATEVLTWHKKYSSYLFAIRANKVASAKEWIDGLPIDKLLEFCPPSEWM